MALLCNLSSSFNLQEVCLMPFAGIVGFPLEEARVVILPIPYGTTLSYGTGAMHGPVALLSASRHLELFDEELLQEFATVKWHTLPLMELNFSSPEAMTALIYAQSLELLRAGKWLATIGGEHTVTLGIVKALREIRFEQLAEPFSVLQLDAHTDLRAEYQATPYSHACVMRRIFDLGLPFVQVGIRSMSAEEWQFIRDHHLEEGIFWSRHMMQASQRGEESWMERVVEALLPTVYVTIDMDGFDPSQVPAVGTPEPGGMDYYTVLRLLRRVAERRKIIGCDIVELSPLAGQPASDFFAARLLHKLIGYTFFLP